MRTRWLQLGLSVLLGAVAALLTRDIPGDGSWMVVCWILGAAAAALQPSWASFGACVAGITLATIALVGAAGQYAGLAWLVVAAEAAILGHGFLVSATVRRAWRLRSLRDERVVWGFMAAIGLVVALFLVAQDFARNPP
jgi:hypothetical protein